jgi:bifunctional ADP-heptose synthase (sugar kinase/adenylyltransferase)
LDTRSKIVPFHELEERLKNRSARWISGHFDPLLAEHVERLRQTREPGNLLVVEITDPERPLLSQRARAELVAALAMVDYVVLQNGQPPRTAATDADLTQGFIDHVLERHRQERDHEDQK